VTRELFFSIIPVCSLVCKNNGTLIMDRNQEIRWNAVNPIDTPYYKVFAKCYLANLGITNPTPQLLTHIQVLYFENRLRQPIIINLGLSSHEKQYLYFAAQGKTFKEIAALLTISRRKARQYRQSILQKLLCKTMSSAIIVCIRFGVINARRRQFL
jgi:DNA-binding CsgD family transcriptional regulator